MLWSPEVTADLESFDTPLAAATLRDFAEVLTNWYVRRSRERFWSGDDRDAFDTLYTVLETLTRVAAPLAPLVAEEIWQGLTGGRSVHLEDWPLAERFPANPTLVAAMDLVREVASAGLALRKSRGLRVRLPLARITVVTADPRALGEFGEILGEELNVKQVDLVEFDEDSLEAFGIERTLTVNARAAGPRIGKQVQFGHPGGQAGDWRQSGDTVVVGDVELVGESSNSSCPRHPNRPRSPSCRGRIRAARHRDPRRSWRRRASRATSSGSFRTPARPPTSG